MNVGHITNNGFKIDGIQLLILEPLNGAKRFNMTFEKTIEVTYKIDSNGNLIEGDPSSENLIMQYVDSDNESNPDGTR